jgi:hypothetical protein
VNVRLGTLVGQLKRSDRVGERNVGVDAVEIREQRGQLTKVNSWPLVIVVLIMYWLPNASNRRLVSSAKDEVVVEAWSTTEFHPIKLKVENSSLIRGFFQIFWLDHFF